MSSGEIYTKEFFDIIREGSRRSAERVVPIVLEYIQPKSVIDVGCGTGEWLAVFKKHGVDYVLGLDGHYVDRHWLSIPADQFVAVDLRYSMGNRWGKFDLVVSLEVAEHLPEWSASTFVNYLTELGPVVLFSAALPGQEGTDHINLQPFEYWADHFARHSYVPRFHIREKLRDIPGIEPWYAQNIVFFVHEGIDLGY